MVPAMIKNARAAEQMVLAYWKKLRPHYPDHPEAPLWMACLAAFPVGITIDLLHQLWANFRELKDRNGKIYQLPPLVVNDCILSSLFRITGKDIYEMPSDTRAFLLSVFKQTFGEAIIADLASFLYKYIKEKRTSDFSENYYNAQEWTALLAVDAKQAAINILTTIRSEMEKGQGQSIGVTNLLTTLVKENHDLAEMLRKAIDKKQDHEEITEATTVAEERATYITNKNINIKPATGETGITIDLPGTFSNMLMPLYEAGVAETYAPENETAKKGRVYAVVVAGTTASQVEWELAKAFSDLLRNKKLIEGENTYTLYGESATHSNVIAVLHNVVSQAAADDTVLFCFLGQSTKTGTITHLGLQDSLLGTTNENNPFSRTERTLTNEAFSELVNRHATNNPAIILLLDAFKCTPFDWLPKNHQNHIIIAPDDAIDESTGLTPGLVSTFINLLSASKQNLTYKEIIAHLVTNEKHWPRFIIQPEKLDNYFLTIIKQSPILQIQQLLSRLGHSLFVDGKPGQQYDKVLQDFTTQYGLAENDDVLIELQKALQLKNKSQIKIFYISPEAVSTPKEIRDQQERLKQEFKEEIETGNKVSILTIEDFENDSDETLYERITEDIHLLFVGLDSSWIEDTNKRKEFYAGLSIFLSLNKIIYFVIEEECDWHSLPLTNNRVLPLSFQPINQENGMQDLIRDVSAIAASMEKYLRPEHPAAEPSDIEQRIREARRTKELNLSGLSLTEMPSAVLQIEGLISLDLSNNNITNLPEDIGQLHTLRKVNLSRNPIEALSENIILLQLEEIDLRETRVERLARSIGQLSNLRSLRIDHTRIRVLPVGFFLNGLPAELTYEGLNLLNLDPTIDKTASLAEYFKPFHPKEFAILEIHSETVRPHYNTVPDDIKDNVHYGFYSQVDTLHNVFKIIYTEAGAKHTIVYINDEKNILAPQFGNESERQSLIYQYWQAFGKPLNLIIDNPRMQSHAFADLGGGGELNFVAVRNDEPLKGGGFPELFFKTIWEHSTADKSYNVFISTNSQEKTKENQFLIKELEQAGHEVISEFDYIANLKPIGLAAKPLLAQLKGTIAKADLVIFLIQENSFSNRTSIPLLEEQYKAAVQLKKKILLFLQENLSDTSDPLIADLLKIKGANAIIDVYRNEKDLLEKTHSSIAHFKKQKHADKRMSLANTLKLLQKGFSPYDKSLGYNLDLGYHVYFNYEKLQDFSLPLGKKKPVNRPARVSINKTVFDHLRQRKAQEMKPFNGQWVLVAGSGGEKLKQTEILCAQAVGEMLATQGYGLICGGWSGVDYLVSQAFEKVYFFNKQSVKSSLLQVLNPGQKPFTGGKHKQVKTTEWNEYAVKKAFAVIIIGGASLTKSTYEYARKKQVPVIPIPCTQKAAADIYNDLKKDKPHLYSIVLLQSMEAVVETAAQAEIIAGMIQIALYELPKNRAVRDTFKQTVEQLYKEREFKVPDDSQKSRWGGKAINNGKRLQARVEPSDSPGNYHLDVTVSGKSLTGPVALFLDSSYDEEIIYSTAVNNEARFHLVSYEAFTLGAYTEDGTMLELDLNKVNGYPPAFYYNDPTPAFKEMVESLYHANPVKDRDDLQKERWGGKSDNEGLNLRATVTETYTNGWYNVHITVKAAGKRPFYGEVALFIHDSFDEEIRYCKVRDGQASLNVLASEAFTIGAYTDEGIFLELDLQEQKGYPLAFYFAEEGAKRKPKPKAKASLKPLRPPKKRGMAKRSSKRKK